MVQPLSKDCCYSTELGMAILGSLLWNLSWVITVGFEIPNTYLNSSKTLKKNWFGKLGTLLMENAHLSFPLWRYCHTDHEIPGKEVISQSSLWSYLLTLMIDTSCILDIQRNTWKSEWMNGRVNHSFNKSVYYQSSYIFFNFKITNFLSIIDFQ